MKMNNLDVTLIYIMGFACGFLAHNYIMIIAQKLGDKIVKNIAICIVIIVVAMIITLACTAAMAGGTHIKRQNPPDGVERILEKIHNGKGPLEYIFKSDQGHFCAVTETDFVTATINQAWVCKTGWYWYENDIKRVDNVRRDDAH